MITLEKEEYKTYKDVLNYLTRLRQYFYCKYSGKFFMFENKENFYLYRSLNSVKKAYSKKQGMGNIYQID